MSQLEYGDYYKFVASAGIALLLIAWLVPWAFLREPFDLTLEVSKVALLTPEAQGVIHRRQHLIAIVMSVVPVISVILSLVGAVLTACGLLKWRARQTVRDRGEDLDVEKKHRELQNMSRQEVEDKASKEAERLEDLPMHARAVSPPTSSIYLAIESAVLDRLRRCFGANVQSNQRLGKAEFDAIVKSGSERIIVEIKYIRKGFYQGWLNESLSSLGIRTQLYSDTFSRTARGVLLIVLGPDSRPDLVQLVDETSKKMRFAPSSSFSDLHVVTLREAEIATISCADLKDLLG
jgi:hypothetical protein